MLLKLLCDERGQTLTEYGLIMLLVTTVVIAGVAVFRDVLVETFNDITTDYPSETG
jgi:Flp pilus assembly pilin Flp